MLWGVWGGEGTSSTGSSEGDPLVAVFLRGRGRGSNFCLLVYFLVARGRVLLGHWGGGEGVGVGVLLLGGRIMDFWGGYDGGENGGD